MKEGYKDSPVGVIPEDWEITTLSDTGDIISGGTPDTANINFWNGHHAWCTPTDITALKGTRYINKTARNISDEGLNSSSATLLPENSLVICTRATIGDCAINQIPICTNQGFKSIKPNTDWEVSFLYYFINANKPILIKQSSGSTFLEISKSAFEKIPIPKPSKSEQSKIATILSTVDDKIDAITDKITATQELKNGLMQRLLTKGIGHTKFKDSPLGEIPKSWEVVTLGNLVNIKHGHAFDGKSFSTVRNQNLLLTPGNFKIEGGIKFDWEKQKFYNDEFPHDYILKGGDLIIALTDLTQSCDILGSPAFIPDESFYYLHNQRLGLVTIRDDKKLNVFFLYHFFNSKPYRYYMKSTKTGTTVSHTSPKTVYSVIIQIPTIYEQQEIAEILSEVDEKLLVLQEKKTQYYQLKQGLMQQLLTGNIRVNKVSLE